MVTYSEKVMEHFMNPHNVGEIEDADGIGQIGNPVCGDMMTFYIKVKDNRLEDVKYKTFGCGAAIATSSILTERVKGATLDEALRISEETAKEVLSQLPKEKFPCFTLAADALKLAIEECRCKQTGGHDHKRFNVMEMDRE